MNKSDALLTAPQLYLLLANGKIFKTVTQHTLAHSFDQDFFKKRSSKYIQYINILYVYQYTVYTVCTPPICFEISNDVDNF